MDGIDDQDTEGVENAIIDIREPLINLKRKLEAKLEIDLTAYDFYLQGTLRSLFQFLYRKFPRQNYLQRFKLCFTIIIPCRYSAPPRRINISRSMYSRRRASTNKRSNQTWS